MRYLSILKDSLREALDTKVIYFTFALSLLVVMLIGSVTFRPVEAQEQFERYSRFLTWAFGMAMQGNGPQHKIEAFEQTNGNDVPWKRDYRFDYVQEFTSDKAVQDAKDRNAFLPARQLQQAFQQDFSWIDKVEVTDTPTGDPKVFRYQVRTTGAKVSDRRGWVYEPRLFFGALPMPIFQTSLSGAVDFIADKIIGTFGAGVIMLLSAIITALFIPNMLRKGAIDLLLAKPIHRWALLVYKFIGGLTFMFLNTAVTMAGIWLVLGIQTGLWANGMLLCVFIFTFQFAIFYVVSTLMAVVTRSPIVAILVSVVVWALLLGIGLGYRVVDSLRPEKVAEIMRERRERAEAWAPPGQKVEEPPDQAPVVPKWVFVTADIVHFVTPHYKDLDVLTTRLIRRDVLDPASKQHEQLDKQVSSINWTESLSVTTGFIALMLGLACWRFAVRDY
jgi:hypothetical protein